jgi:hypothetical protein
MIIMMTPNRNFKLNFRRTTVIANLPVANLKLKAQESGSGSARALPALYS